MTCVPVFHCERKGGREWINLYVIDNGNGEIERGGPLRILEGEILERLSGVDYLIFSI